MGTLAPAAVRVVVVSCWGLLGCREKQLRTDGIGEELKGLLGTRQISWRPGKCGVVEVAAYAKRMSKVTRV